MDTSTHRDGVPDGDARLAEELEQDLELQDDAADAVRGGAAAGEVIIVKEVDKATPL